jgi:hypothetical protein
MKEHVDLARGLFQSVEAAFEVKQKIEIVIEIEIEVKTKIVYNMYRMRRFATYTVCAGCCL